MGKFCPEILWVFPEQLKTKLFGEMDQKHIGSENRIHSWCLTLAHLVLHGVVAPTVMADCVKRVIDRLVCRDLAWYNLLFRAIQVCLVPLRSRDPKCKWRSHLRVQQNAHLVSGCSLNLRSSPRGGPS